MATSWNVMANEQIAIELGKAIRGMRLRQNLSQGELATLAGVSLPTLNRMEAGAANPSLFVLLSVLKALGRAGDLEEAFAPESSPLLLATGATGLPRRRARRSKVGSQGAGAGPATTTAASTADSAAPAWVWGDEK
jgi:transcriptional regulator with XRE-family HTH domain